MQGALTHSPPGLILPRRAGWPGISVTFRGVTTLTYCSLRLPLSPPSPSHSPHVTYILCRARYLLHRLIVSDSQTSDWFAFVNTDAPDGSARGKILPGTVLHWCTLITFLLGGGVCFRNKKFIWSFLMLARYFSLLHVKPLNLESVFDTSVAPVPLRRQFLLLNFFVAASAMSPYEDASFISQLSAGG